MRVIWKVVATEFYFKNEARNSMKEYIFRFINIPSRNQARDNLDTPHVARAEHRQVRSMLWQCLKIYFDTGVILDEKFFLKIKSFLFSLLCIIHINWAYQNVIPLPSVKYDRLYISKIQFCVKYMLYKMRSIGTSVNHMTLSTGLL